MFQKSPCFVVPSDSETSLTSFGMTHQDVLPRRVSAEGPLALLGATKKMARGDKKEGSGRQPIHFFPRHTSDESPPSPYILFKIQLGNQ
jgi:hypothetical protein